LGIGFWGHCDTQAKSDPHHFCVLIVHIGAYRIMSRKRPVPKSKGPQEVKHRGRSGTIYFWKNGYFGVRVVFGTDLYRNSFKTYDAAYKDIIEQIEKFENNPKESAVLFPLRHERQVYSEIESLLAEQCDGATIKDAATFFLKHHKKNAIQKKTVTECYRDFYDSQKGANKSLDHLRTLKKHIDRFNECFGDRYIDEISTKEVHDYLYSRRNRPHQKKDTKPRDPNPATENLWSPTTLNNNRGTLVSMANYARDVLRAIEKGDTAFELVPKATEDNKGEVEIFSPQEMEQLLLAAVESDLEILPVIVLQGFEGLRPSEAHGERNKRPRLTWEEINRTAGFVDLTHQKVRKLRSRHVPLSPNADEWLSPYINLGYSGTIWTPKESYTARYEKLRKLAQVRSVQDGLRHSYASYRVKITGDLKKTALEMGNSEREIINHYRRVSSTEDATAWFDIRPPADFAEKLRRWHLRR